MDNPLAAARKVGVVAAGGSTSRHATAASRGEAGRSPGGATVASAPATATSTSSHSRKIEGLWHRKTNAGYRLFLQYYFGQPEGVVVAAGAASHPNDGNGDGEEGASPLPSPPPAATLSSLSAGALATTTIGKREMSRASRRRRRKQGYQSSTPNRQQHPPPMAMTTTTTRDSEQDRLLQQPSLSSSPSQHDCDAAAPPPPPPPPPRLQQGRRDGSGTTDESRDHPLQHAFCEICVSNERYQPAIRGSSAAAAAAANKRRKKDDQRASSPSWSSFFLFRHFVDALSRPLPVSFRIRLGIDPELENELMQELEPLARAGHIKAVLVEQEQQQATDINDNDSNDNGAATAAAVGSGTWLLRRRAYQTTGARTLVVAAGSVSEPAAVAKSSSLQSGGGFVPGGSTATCRHNLQQTCPQQLQAFLNRWSHCGGLARQEVGSMLPVWLLHKACSGIFFPNSDAMRKQMSEDGSGDDHHDDAPREDVVRGSATGPSARRRRCRLQSLRVLDLCASPGSKTMQIAEILLLLTTKKRRDGERVGGDDDETTLLPVLRANDVHSGRLASLKDAVSRSGIRGINSILRYSQLDASSFPIPSSENKQYHVVICDVPCSGDGTSRKDPHLLPNWTPNIANALHHTQVSILKRALHLVQVGGIVVYSTCSFNPVENEAVVAAAMASVTTTSSLQKEVSRPHWKLLELPVLHRLTLRPGVARWKVADYIGGVHGYEDGNDNDDEESPVLRWHGTFEDATEAGMEHAGPTLWPHHMPSSALREQLKRCGRLLPQDQDTGGFFVALIQRVS
jgi:16S rRNA C967 or C1407 C5-methylase (RsmB/RsmF family)